MSYTVAPQPPGRVRPPQVAAAVNLLFVTAVLIIVNLGIGIYALVTVVMPAVNRIDNGAPNPASSPAFAIIELVIDLALAAGFVTLGVLVGRGKNPARVVTWSVGGIAALCCGCGALSNAFQGPLLRSLSSVQGADPAINDALNATPTWLTISQGVVQGLIFLAVLTAIILLMLPASNDFFRKEQEVWTPPTWSGPGYPATPPYPPTEPPTAPPSSPPSGPLP